MEHEMKTIEQNLEILKLRLEQLRLSGIEEPFDLEMDIMNTLPEFYENFPSIVKRLCREKDQDNTYLYKMISLLKDVEKGERSLSGVELSLGNELAEKFVYPVVNKLNNDKVIDDKITNVTDNRITEVTDDKTKLGDK
jgi:hypothetical protein